MLLILNAAHDKLAMQEGLSNAAEPLQHPEYGVEGALLGGLMLMAHLNMASDQRCLSAFQLAVAKRVRPTHALAGRRFAPAAL